MAVFSFSNILQVVIALIIILILYIITLVVLNIDSIVTGVDVTVKPNEQIKVFQGYANVSTLLNKQWNTVKQFATNFIKIPRSVNTPGGAQFTYQFWIKINDANDIYYKNLPILLRGDSNPYKIGVYPKDSQKTGLVQTYPADAYIRCPLIQFDNSWRNLIVKFNTFNHPLTEIPIRMNPEGGAGVRRNLLSLLPANWYLMTFIFVDNYSIVNSVENGIKFQFYLNDVLYQTNSASTEMALRNNYLKQNDGNLYLLPNTSVTNGDFMSLGNLSYMNYAPDVEEIRSTFNRGPPSFPVQFTKDEDYKPAVLSAYNKLDIYNY